MKSRSKIHVLVNIGEPLLRDVVESLVLQERGMKIIKFAPTGEPGVDENILDVHAAMRKVHVEKIKEDDRAVVVTSFRSDDEETFRTLYNDHVLEHFPRTVVVGIDQTYPPRVIVLSLVLHCDQASTTVEDLIDAIRRPPLVVDVSRS